MVASAPRCPARLIFTISSNKSIGFRHSSAAQPLLAVPPCLLLLQPTAHPSCCQCSSLSGHYSVRVDTVQPLRWTERGHESDRVSSACSDASLHICALAIVFPPLHLRPVPRQR